MFFSQKSQKLRICVISSRCSSGTASMFSNALSTPNARALLKRCVFGSMNKGFCCTIGGMLSPWIMSKSSSDVTSIPILSATSFITISLTIEL